MMTRRLSTVLILLIATLMTFGRLSQDNEITALRASGVHLFRAMLPPLLAAGGLAMGLTLFNNYVYPDANHAFASLLVDIGRMRPTVKLQEGVFITDFPGYNLLVKSVNGMTNEMRGITIYQMHAGAPPTTILAERGFFGAITLKYEGGKIVHLRKEENLKPSDLSGTPERTNVHSSR